jgi:DMSO/TMAO reductase YedYZ molybdopterin-dependent catalytic subunit
VGVRTAMQLRCLAAVWSALIMLPTGSVGVANADPTSPNPQQLPGTVTVSGDVSATVSFTLDDLHALPNQTEAATFETTAGTEHHTYTGCPLDAIITAANPHADVSAKHPLLTIAVVATGADGYAATLAWAELSPTLAPRPALVAWSEDGVALDQPRLVVPGDLGGARYVRDLIDLRVVQLAG